MQFLNKLIPGVYLRLASWQFVVVCWSRIRVCIEEKNGLASVVRVRIFDWDTPSWLPCGNDESETNLHREKCGPSSAGESVRVVATATKPSASDIPANGEGSWCKATATTID